MVYDGRRGSSGITDVGGSKRYEQACYKFPTEAKREEENIREQPNRQGHPFERPERRRSYKENNKRSESPYLRRGRQIIVRQ